MHCCTVTGLIMHELTGAKSASFNSCVNFLYSTRSYVTKQTRHNNYNTLSLSLVLCPDCLSHDIVEKRNVYSILVPKVSM